MSPDMGCEDRRRSGWASLLGRARSRKTPAAPPTEPPEERPTGRLAFRPTAPHADPPTDPWRRPPGADQLVRSPGAMLVPVTAVGGRWLVDVTAVRVVPPVGAERCEP
jgi:hypothetical protein